VRRCRASSCHSTPSSSPDSGTSPRGLADGHQGRSIPTGQRATAMRSVEAASSLAVASRRAHSCWNSSFSSPSPSPSPSISISWISRSFDTAGPSAPSSTAYQVHLYSVISTSARVLYPTVRPSLRSRPRGDQLRRYRSSALFMARSCRMPRIMRSAAGAMTTRAASDAARATAVCAGVATWLIAPPFVRVQVQVQDLAARLRQSGGWPRFCSLRTWSGCGPGSWTEMERTRQPQPAKKCRDHGLVPSAAHDKGGRSSSQARTEPRLVSPALTRG
jgi:hypothetical protein